MNKFFFGLWLALFPVLVMADSTTSTMSFTPPTTDFSVAFLANIFGVVDGVLHGTGSQIMGAIFTVFNAAVLALGGIVIMYTLLIGTMNTAHEGEMLGKKWSSIWIPIRATVGLALLIPKTTGYCLMQIFVMWVVVQGIGAADKVWNAALNYLNRGGVIIQATMSSATSTAADGGHIVTGAQAILTGEVCMLGIQKQLETVRQNYLDQLNASGSSTSSSGESTNSIPVAAGATGPCAGIPTPCTTTASCQMQSFCNTAVPSFLTTVDAVAFENKSPNQTTAYQLPMPNFDSTSIYSNLNGICGLISWNPITSTPTTTTNTTTDSNGNTVKVTTAVTPESTTTTTTTYDSSGAMVGEPVVVVSQGSDTTLSATDWASVNISRATAIQQMYIDLGMVAQSMISNDPQITTSTGTSTAPAYPQATSVFGVPYLSSGGPCQTTSSACSLWQGDTGSDGVMSSAIFHGSEFQNSIADYNAIMAPTVNLLNENASASNQNNARAFIATAEADGWLTAGSYFFDLVNLNGNAVPTTSTTDTNTGLETSKTPGNLLAPFTNVSGSTCDSTLSASSYPMLCTLLNGNTSYAQAVIDLLGTPVSANISTDTKALAGSAAATTYGFITNSMIIQIPGGQPGLIPPTFAMNFNFKIDQAIFSLPPVNIACGPKIFGWCGGQAIASALYNSVVKPIFSFFMNQLVSVENLIIETILVVPLSLMQQLFQTQVAYLQQPGVNPIVALASMGAGYINAAANLWLDIINLNLLTLGMATPLIALCLPLIVGWMGVMVGVGFLTAYYVPFIPYMIFTFGVIAWLMAVIEAMVAAPIVALGVTHPEGEGVLGKAEQAIMILMNVFLRPSMMIIGYIAAIALTYVGVWIINTGFGHVAGFLQGSSSASSSTLTTSTGTSYTNWAGMFGMFFSVLIYTSLYLTVVEKAFNLIYLLPDHVLRWIGGQAESVGQETAQWGEATKGKVEKGSEATQKAQGQIAKSAQGAATELAGAVTSAVSKAKPKGGEVEAESGGGEGG